MPTTSHPTTTHILHHNHLTSTTEHPRLLSAHTHTPHKPNHHPHISYRILLLTPHAYPAASSNHHPTHNTSLLLFSHILAFFSHSADTPFHHLLSSFTAFNEELYNTIVKNKKVIAECCVDLDDDEYPEVREQIVLREEEIEEHGGHTFRSFVRGVPIDFSPENIRTVMRFRTQVQGATTDFETRKEHDQQLDRVLADLCMPGATWKLSTGQLRVPIQLRRQELNPIARGWHEFSIHSLIPSSNRSEIPVIRAILIHCIMRGEDVRAEDIIADKMVRMAQGIKEKGKLGFPSTIYKLCKEAGVPLREFRRTKKIQVEKPITARRMESTRLPRPVQHRQQEDEEEDHPMPQAEEGNEEGNEEGQGYEHEYHHQPPLYHVPTYTDQHEKDLHSIETQLQNMMWYQQQTLENISKNQAEYMAELREMKGNQQELYENNDKFYNQVRQE
ncbi:hypothetical protein PIB30_093907 [Stylosanthes scabra]|uniref:Putative plant transposon protein domain-containing protein n=1 Tax=Stylosanthes scabra TaxID=79078 RepID=A0ABU6QUL7_9FABA|nr:hypothetical protein [Stylosanthes scabra]